MTDPSTQTSQNLVLRGYRPGDLDTLYGIDVACFSVPFRFSKTLLQHLVEMPGALTLIAETPAMLAGFSIVHVKRNRAGKFGYVVTLDVLEAYRRGGLGSLLLREGERLAAAQAAAMMRLHVYAGDPGARSFYERMEYVERATVRDFYGRALDALVLEKPLANSRGVDRSDPDA